MWLKNCGCIIPYLSQFVKNGTYLSLNLFVKVNGHNTRISTEQKSSNFGENKTLTALCLILPHLLKISKEPDLGVKNWYPYISCVPKF